MTGKGGDVWICGACRSVNPRRETRCYSCLTPRGIAKVDAAALPVYGDVASVTGAALPRYRSSRIRALIARNIVLLALLAIAFAGVLQADTVSFLAFREFEMLTGPDELLRAVTGARIVLVAIAFVAFGRWLSRVVANVPALGLGYTQVSPRLAFIECLIPVWNLFRVPAIIRDVMDRLEAGNRGNALMVAAWTGIVGGIALPWLLFAAVAYLFPRTVRSNLELLNQATTFLAQLGVGLILAGGVFLVLMIGWLDRRMAERAQRMDRARAQGS
jgi:hypothetical protein